MTNYAAACASIRSRFTTEWGSTTTIYWDIGHAEPGTSDAYVDFEVGTVTAEQTSFGAKGSNRERHKGLIVATVYGQAADWPATIETHARDIADIFKSETFSGVTCFSRIKFEKADAYAGNWRGLKVTIPFYFDNTV